MTYPNVESPVMGEKLRAGWGASVSAAIDAHEADLQALRRPGKWESRRVGDDTPLTPFTVRLHKTEDDPNGQWEIYLPAGCCSVGGPCEPFNDKASGKSGHEDDDDAWRSLGAINGWSYFGLEEETGPGFRRLTRRVAVDVHVKASALDADADQLDAPARRLMWACFRDLLDDDAPDYPEESAGDIWSGTVAVVTRVQTITAVPLADIKTYSVRQVRTTPIDLVVPQGSGVSGFDLVWCLARETRDHPAPVTPALAVRKLLCVRQTAAAAGIALTGDAMTDVVNAETIYARIDATDMRDGGGIVQVAKDPQGVSVSTPYVVWLPLYELTNNCVRSDYRSQSLVNLQLFHA